MQYDMVHILLNLTLFLVGTLIKNEIKMICCLGVVRLLFSSVIQPLCFTPGHVTERRPPKNKSHEIGIKLELPKYANKYGKQLDFI